jgi:hypothetical protein
MPKRSALLLISWCLMLATCAHRPTRTPLAPAGTSDAAVRLTLAGSQTPETLVDMSGMWNTVQLPPNTVVLPGAADAAGNFSQSTNDVVCDVAAPTTWCQTNAPGWTIIISDTNLAVTGSTVTGSLGWTMIYKGVPLMTTVKLSGTYSGGTYDVAEVGQPDWNMQLRPQ